MPAVGLSFLNELNELDELEIEENTGTYYEIETESDLEKVKTSISVLKKVVRKKIIENPQELDNALNHVLSFLIKQTLKKIMIERVTEHTE